MSGKADRHTPEEYLDLISRYAAINAVLLTDAIFDAETYEAYQKTRDVISALEGLKSEQPAQPEIVRCHQCIHWDRDTVRRNSNDAGWWNEAICERYSDEIWESWKDADWYCADAERRDE